MVSRVEAPPEPMVSADLRPLAFSVVGLLVLVWAVPDAGGLLVDLVKWGMGGTFGYSRLTEVVMRLAIGLWLLWRWRGTRA